MSKDKYKPEQSVYERIVKAYQKSGSVKTACEQGGVSEVTARRVLITEGLWSSKTSRRVMELLQSGLSVEKIAKEMSVSKNAVAAYMPYSRGMYGNSITENSKNAKEYRARKAKAHEGVSTLTGNGEDRTIIRSGRKTGKSIETEDKAEPGNAGSESQDVVLELHMKLVGKDIDCVDPNLNLSKPEKKKLLSLAKAKNEFSRDVLVPGDMNLHALHYAIQKLFGWQNSHLHNFSLPREDFIWTTEGKYGPYTNLSGVLFRFPDEDLADQYWDDDYEENISVKNWLRKKYSAPFRRGAISDTYLGNDWKLEEFEEQYRDFGYDAELKSIRQEVIIGGNFDCLMEHLTVGELFLPENSPKISEPEWLEEMWSRADELDRMFIESEPDLDELRFAADELRAWRMSADDLDRLKWLSPDTYQKEVREHLNMSYEEAIAMHKKQISRYSSRCRKLFYDWNVALEPYFPRIYYEYDYGDDWCIEITAKERQHNRLAYLALNGKPVCIAADGLNLVDDCGGIHGYLNMLETIYGRDALKAEDMKNWARSLGWTGKMSTPEKML